MPRLLLSTHLILLKPVKESLLGDNDSSWRLFWEALHKRHAEWTGEFATYDPVRGWTLKPGVRDLTPFQPGKFLNSNSKGVRGQTEHDYSRTPGKQRILVFGDSFTFGTEVSDDETYSHYLESDLPNTEVLNFGIQGYGHDQMLLYLQREGVKYHPDVVIVGFVFIDSYRNLWRFFAFAKPKFEMTREGLVLTNVPVPTPEQVLAQEPYRSKAIDLAMILQDRIMWALGANEKKARNLTRSIMDEMIATIRGVGAVPVFMYMPVYEEIRDSSDSMNGHEKFLYDYCHDRGVACLFIRPRFRQAIKDGAKMETRFHWSPEMHRMAAQELADFLASKGLVREEPAQAVRR